MPDPAELELLPVPTQDGSVLMPCRLKRSRSSRYFKLSIDWDGTAILTLPGRASRKEGLRFLESRGDWLSEAVHRSPRAQSLWRLLNRQSWLSLDGQKVPLELGFSRARSLWVRDHQRVVLRVDPSGEREHELVELLREVAAESLPKQVRALADSAGLQVGRITVRNQRSRWGSCSCSGNISLNWRLLLLEPALCDYVIWHELAHLREMNHSKAYWSHLESLCPGARRLDRRLSRLEGRYFVLAPS